MSVTASAAAAAAAAAASPRPPSSALYTERLFYAVLKQGNPSEARVEALAALALRHLPKSAETWAALRKALMEQSDLDGAPNRTLWYVLDALIKHAPHVFVPLVAPRLLEYTIQQLPWELAGHRGQTLLWFEALVLSWEKVLPQRLYSAVRQHAVQSRSGAELHDLLEAAENSVDDGTSASPADLQQLRDAWDAVQYMGEQEAGKSVFHARLIAAAVVVADEDGNSSLSPSPPVSGLYATPTGHNGRTAGAGTSGADIANTQQQQQQQEEDEYTPDFIEGAKPRELPKLDLPKLKRRREGRRRPREEDLGM
ncbi:conserved hypothetical protein [Leishmania major strain Friedlin]|uniref:Uncharacterized protein n=1 Tax=Leishmania major TaxID=5664 RepID=Q4QAC0_LEIMA|nr:conserved hypothetical protein [Leishmania major strain Friedlin]CAG9574707.1 hypothetical_protein_-_conserved [Leishmania major strain Friedlin]CAJ05353.1 conserved hypothetical protein [Leishmania major strain Friedlin]|eukprot:XP_001683728.1 conserved hypothetical protein [Leishmania major strain Friedlin]